MDRMSIETAKDGGYIVQANHEYERSAPMFAGSLAECLDYVRAKIRKHVAHPQTETPQ